VLASKRVDSPLVVLDADVLGRQRTGEETYLANLLARLPHVAGDELRFAALTRNPTLVPEGVDAVELPARSQELRMGWSVPRALARLGPDLAHFQWALPPRRRVPSVVTIHDLSFERDRSVLPLHEWLVFKVAVRRAAKRADHVIAVSERTKRDIVELYGIDEVRVTVAPHGVGDEFRPGPVSGSYLLFVGVVQERKNPLVAADAAASAGLPLIAAGPVRDEALAAELRARGVDVRGYVSQEELVGLYQGAAALLFPSSYEGFGLPLVEAMACGIPVVATPDPALEEVAGGVAVFVEPARMAEGIARALADRPRLRELGLGRAKRFSWDESARRTAEVYRRVLERRH
jgi:glycosyltransferase involved in cell wall biosynthesis